MHKERSIILAIIICVVGCMAARAENDERVGATCFDRAMLDDMNEKGQTGTAVYESLRFDVECRAKTIVGHFSLRPNPLADNPELYSRVGETLRASLCSPSANFGPALNDGWRFRFHMQLNGKDVTPPIYISSCKSNEIIQ